MKSAKSVIDLKLGIVVAIAFLLLNAFYIAPTIGFGDSGELAAAAISLGLSHPPGHPGYIYSAWAWLHLFKSDSPGWILNLFSCFLLSINIMLFSSLVKHASLLIGVNRPSPWISISFATAFASLPFIRYFGTTVEVYHLQWVFLSGFLIEFLKYAKNPTRQLWLRLWLLLALAISVHPFSVFYVILPILYGVFNRKSLTWHHFGYPFIPAGISATLYLSLPWTTNHGNAFHWPHLSTWEGWLNYFTAREYEDRFFVQDVFKHLYNQLLDTVPLILGKGVWVCAILGILGLIYLQFRKVHAPGRMKLILSLGFCILAGIPFLSTGLKNSLDITSYFWGPVIVLCLIAAVACQDLLIRHPKWAQTSILGMVGFTVFLLINYHSEIYRKHNIFPEFLAEIISLNVQKDSLLLVKDDASYFSLMYLQYGLEKRQDMNIIHVDLLQKHPVFFEQQFPDILFPERLPQTPQAILRTMVEYNNKERNVYWFGDDKYIHGMKPAIQLDHLVWFTSKEPRGYLPLFPAIRGLTNDQKDAYRGDPIARKIFSSAISRMVYKELKTGNYQGALNYTTQWLNIFPYDVPIIAIKAWLLIQKKQFVAANELIQPVLNTDEPTELLIYCRLKILAQKSAQIGQRDLLEQHMDLVNKSILLTNEYMTCLMDQGAFTHADDFLVQHPFFDQLVRLRAELAFHQGESPRAIKLLEEYLENKKGDPIALQLLIYYLTLAGEEEKQVKWGLLFNERFPNHKFSQKIDKLLFEKFIQ